MLISFWIDAPGTDPGGAPPPIYTKYPKMFAPPSARRNFFKSAPLTWNPGSAPDINLNMYIINVIADDESKIGLYEI